MVGDHTLTLEQKFKIQLYRTTIKNLAETGRLKEALDLIVKTEQHHHVRQNLLHEQLKTHWGL